MPVTAMWRWDFALASFSLQAFRHMGCGVAIYLLSPRSPIRKIGRAMFAGIAPFFLTTNRSASEEAIQGWMQTLTFTGRWEYFRASSNQLPKGTFNMKSIKRDSSRVRQVMLSATVAAGCLTMSANAQTVQNNGTGTNSGYVYSLYSTGGSATMTFPDASKYPGNYAITWSGVNDVVGGKGWNPGSAQTIGYNVGEATGYNNISIYGWTTNPLVEYYICEFGSVATGTYKGSVSSDGHTYSTYEHQQVNQPSIQGTATFEQYLDNWGGASIGSNGTVTTANHFNHWKSLGMNMGAFNYQILGTEAYGGRSGSVNATVW